MPKTRVDLVWRVGNALTDYGPDLSLPSLCFLSIILPLSVQKPTSTHLALTHHVRPQYPFEDSAFNR